MSAHTRKTPNRLAHETSPYLLQHAYNPVDWHPWGEEALQKARDQDKPMLVSIGYSACHWCHVMERESFESEAVAHIMNEQYICIKVDREERPDVDAVYMDALHAMGLQGGWPLNVFLTPEAKPFYGGTYFPPDHWADLLGQIAAAYRQQRDKIEESAESFAQHLGIPDRQKYKLEGNLQPPARPELETVFDGLAKHFDTERGGMRRDRNKFPMPSIYLLLLRHWQATGQEAALRQVRLSLDRMALGGIYDQAGGGFARYSTDPEWFAPHFEKMLYDNGQLVSLYAEAYAATHDPLYKHIVYQTIDFLERELTSPEGGFYAALDADSEGQEGKFYVWTMAEIRAALGDAAGPVAAYYGLTESGNWEHGNNILHATERPETFAARNGLDAATFSQTLAHAHRRLMAVRAGRVRPGLDDKVLASWNGLMLRGLVDAYRVFGEVRFLQLALRSAAFLREKMREGPRLWHSYKNGRATVNGFLEDYAFVADAYAALYQATSDETWLREALILTDYVLENFHDPADALFFFTDATAERLIVRKKELFDNVMPASNSALAKTLHTLGLLSGRDHYLELSDRMLGQVQPLVRTDAQYLSNWAGLLVQRARPTAEIIVIGPEAFAFRHALEQHYFPNKVLVASPVAVTSGLSPLLHGRQAAGGKTTVYVCFGRTCRLPVHSVAEALAQLSATDFLQEG